MADPMPAVILQRGKPAIFRERMRLVDLKCEVTIPGLQVMAAADVSPASSERQQCPKSRRVSIESGLGL